MEKAGGANGMGAMELKKVCVFCGSSDRALEKYGFLADDFGAELVRNKIGLVYGGAAVGLMGRLADAVMHAGGEAYGFIPKDMSERSQFGPSGNTEVAHKGITELVLVEDMHERKKNMYESADAFCALPGGIGTLEELSEVLTWNGLGYHGRIKPIVLLDEGKYWNHFWDFLSYMVAEGFLRQQWLDCMKRVRTPKEALSFLSA